MPIACFIRYSKKKLGRCSHGTGGLVRHGPRTQRASSLTPPRAAATTRSSHPSRKGHRQRAAVDPRRPGDQGRGLPTTYSHPAEARRSTRRSTSQTNPPPKLLRRASCPCGALSACEGKKNPSGSASSRSLPVTPPASASIRFCIGAVLTLVVKTFGLAGCRQPTSVCRYVHVLSSRCCLPRPLVSRLALLVWSHSCRCSSFLFGSLRSDTHSSRRFLHNVRDVSSGG